ncbi:MAG: hypothetical protein LBS09_07225 [Bacteroidales bacterium]|jgi:hypothetical protein|nr:hypothetical protein [Bacteroidales bacterium]
MKGNFWGGFAIGVIVALLMIGVFIQPPDESVRVEWYTDTVLIRDTVLIPVPEPYAVRVVRIDTVRVPVFISVERETAGDTATVAIPIEQKEYRTDDYRAVIEGYRANLLSMEVYPTTVTITNTERVTATKKKRFGVGIQAGYGFNGTRFTPYVGVGVQYNIAGWRRR